MTMQDFVLKTFIAYIIIKALILLPLAWMALVAWWSERSGDALTPAKKE